MRHETVPENTVTVSSTVCPKKKEPAMGLCRNRNEYFKAADNLENACAVRHIGKSQLAKYIRYDL